ncbi:hypothetical protein HFU84_09205 [Acidithiobacillus sp. CV18-2]|nr:hypothetical protein [Acidithiobacillus sp. CV18-3]MBU2758043.1 hypothetical protein [Acidithiobacillus sp. BN09-2]MBU2777680.1 hypothetical protein [Acidithiobacillus sp. CV18-2]MBU2799394.1 hypothetical protein [Acidithiobacillus sp. VAN18-4]
MADKPKILGEAAFRTRCVNDPEWSRILAEGLLAVESMDQERLVAAVIAITEREDQLRGAGHDQ